MRVFVLVGLCACSGRATLTVNAAGSSVSLVKARPCSSIEPLVVEEKIVNLCIDLPCGQGQSVRRCSNETAPGVFCFDGCTEGRVCEAIDPSSRCTADGCSPAVVDLLVDAGVIAAGSSRSFSLPGGCWDLLAIAGEREVRAVTNLGAGESFGWSVK